MKTMRCASLASLAVGGWLMTSSWVLSAMHAPPTPAVDATVVGAALVVIVTVAEVLRARWTPWHTLLLSGWAVAALAALELTSKVVPSSSGLSRWR